MTGARATWLSLGEGGTPLVRAPRLSEALGLDLHLKCEHLNPTGSFKDRGMAVAVERAAARGVRTVVCASTGNTAASAATYAARAGLRAVVLTPEGATAGAKRAQAHAAGAQVLEVRGTFDDALRLCRELGERDGFLLVNSVNPDRIDGQRSVVGEIVDQFGSVPDVIALPYGGGGNVLGGARPAATKRVCHPRSSWARRLTGRRPSRRRSGSRSRRIASGFNGWSLTGA